VFREAWGLTGKFYKPPFAKGRQPAGLWAQMFPSVAAMCLGSGDLLLVLCICEHLN
jgi:hypothetical protein